MAKSMLGSTLDPLVRGVKKLIPVRVKESIKSWLRRRTFSRALRDLRSLPPGTLPDARLLDRLRAGWGNLAYSAKTGYLTEVLRCIIARPGPVLECGSGLSTVLMAIVGAPLGVEVCSLENHPEWRTRILKCLEEAGIRNVRVVFAPLVARSDYDWYEPDPNVLPSGIRVVVCDGPPESTTRGGRFGVVPEMLDRFAPDVTLIADDASTATCRGVLRRWATEYGLRSRLGGSGDAEYAVLELA